MEETAQYNVSEVVKDDTASFHSIKTEKGVRKGVLCATKMGNERTQHITVLPDQENLHAQWKTVFNLTITKQNSLKYNNNLILKFLKWHTTNICCVVNHL